jgi:CheY-like chemotaxis protein
MPDECRRYHEAGMDDVVLKPISAARLAAVLARHAMAEPWTSVLQP